MPGRRRQRRRNHQCGRCRRHGTPALGTLVHPVTHTDAHIQCDGYGIAYLECHGSFDPDCFAHSNFSCSRKPDTHPCNDAEFHAYAFNHADADTYADTDKAGDCGSESESFRDSSTVGHSDCQSVPTCYRNSYAPEQRDVYSLSD